MHIVLITMVRTSKILFTSSRLTLPQVPVLSRTAHATVYFYSPDHDSSYVYVWQCFLTDNHTILCCPLKTVSLSQNESYYSSWCKRKGYVMNNIAWNMNTLLQMCKQTHNTASAHINIKQHSYNSLHLLYLFKWLSLMFFQIDFNMFHQYSTHLLITHMAYANCAASLPLNIVIA
jgi:hypothetical protein